MATSVFISYSHGDEKALARLHKHLAMLRRDGTLSTWTDHAIVPGAKISDAINSQLDRSGIFLALLSADYLASNYCYETEFKRALELADAGRIRIVPVVLEPCDWLSSPFKDFLALPKDGQPVSEWTNQNNAYLDIVTGLRRLADTVDSLRKQVEGGGAPAGGSGAASSRKPRIKQHFDAIQTAEFADRAYDVICKFFEASCTELSNVDEALRARFEIMEPTAFTCTVVNRALQGGGEAHITVRNMKSRRGGFGDISYVYQRYHTAGTTSNGSIRVGSDDYAMFLEMDQMAVMSGGKQGRLTPETAAEQLWTAFVKQAGVEYE